MSVFLIIIIWFDLIFLFFSFLGFTHYGWNHECNYDFHSKWNINELLICSYYFVASLSYQSLVYSISQFENWIQIGYNIFKLDIVFSNWILYFQIGYYIFKYDIIFSNWILYFQIGSLQIWKYLTTVIIKSLHNFFVGAIRIYF